MITRGYIVGKIIDDIALLKSQISLKAKLGLYDLHKIVEDFFKEILNITYNYSLVNLNKVRCNHPGLDLGDKHNKIAFQITSMNTSDKINETLKKITIQLGKQYKTINIFIVGEKQKKYTIDKTLASKYKFDPQKNAFDLNDLIKEITMLDIDKLNQIYEIFRREFMQVKIEFEIPDKNGNYETSLYNLLENQNFKKPNNYDKFFDWYNKKNGSNALNGHYKDEYISDIKQLFNKLISLPRTSREFILIAQEKGKDGKILLHTLQRLMKLTEQELIAEIQIVEEEGMSKVETVESFEGPNRVYFVNNDSYLLTDIISYCENISIPTRNIIVNMNFMYFENSDA